MTTRKRRLPKSRSDSGAARRSYVRHWTREEQIANAMEDGTVEEMKPPLTADERAEHGL